MKLGVSDRAHRELPREDRVVSLDPGISLKLVSLSYFDPGISLLQYYEFMLIPGSLSLSSLSQSLSLSYFDPGISLSL